MATVKWNWTKNGVLLVHKKSDPPYLFGPKMHLWRDWVPNFFFLKKSGPETRNCPPNTQKMVKMTVFGAYLGPILEKMQKILKSDKYLQTGVTQSKCTFLRTKHIPWDFGVILAPFWAFLGSPDTIQVDFSGTLAPHVQRLATINWTCQRLSKPNMKNYENQEKCQKTRIFHYWSTNVATPPT